MGSERERRCKSCNYQITSDDLEDWLYMQLADTTHLLHGVVHVNGYGHLLKIMEGKVAPNFCQDVILWTSGTGFVKCLGSGGYIYAQITRLLRKLVVKATLKSHFDGFQGQLPFSHVQRNRKN
ncbi:hypothetical protein AAC387_Pa07g1846 [Persea americana]